MSALPSAMIFAAGFGTRMQPLTDTCPKPLIKVAGQPLIDHARAHLREAGVTDVVSNLHYLPDLLDEHLAHSEVRTIRETPDILDTGGGLRNALPLLAPGPVITINPDVIWRGPNPVAYALSHWDPVRMDALLLCLEPVSAHGTDSPGDFVISQTGTLARGQGAIYGGVQIIKPERLHDIPERVFSLNLLWDELISEGRCFGALYPGQWCDVGHPSGIARAERLLEQAP